MTKKILKVQKKIFDSILSKTLTGAVTLLPISVLAGVFIWAFSFLTKVISPLTKVITLSGKMNIFVAQALSLLTIYVLAFTVGSIVKTNIGKFLFGFFEKNVLIKIPFYKIIKNTIDQFFGENKRSPFPKGNVWLVDVYDSGSYMTGFCTDQSVDYLTVFVPTGPNPTSGNIFHIPKLPKKRAIKIDVPVDDAMRTIIGCGMDSYNLTKNLDKKQ